MTTDELIESCIEQNIRFSAQVQEAVAPMNKKQLNQPMSNGDWSVARVLKHMILANGPYLDILPKLIEGAPTGSTIVKHTWFGKALIKFAGPKGNVSPAPNMVPDDLDYSKEILDIWIGQQSTIIELMKQAIGKNTNGAKFKNPSIRLFGMNVTDAFAVMTTHTDRHSQQILQRAKTAVSN